MSTFYSTLLLIISFNQEELREFLQNIFENIFCLKYSERSFRIFLFKNCLYIVISHDYGGTGQERKAAYIADRNEENQEIVLMYPSFCVEFWIWRVTAKRETKEGYFSGDRAPYLGEGGPEESVINLSIQGKCVDISNKIYHMHKAKELEYILKKIQGELDAGENVFLDPKYSDYRPVEDNLRECLTEEYKKKTEEREKAREEWEAKKKTDNINPRRDEEQYKEWEKINPYPRYVYPMTNDVDMEKAHALLEEHRNGAWNKRTNIEEFVNEFGEEKPFKGPAEYNKMRDEEIRKKDLIQKEKEFIQNNFAFVD
jgi:hypothetical protein